MKSVAWPELLVVDFGDTVAYGMSYAALKMRQGDISDHATIE